MDWGWGTTWWGCGGDEDGTCGDGWGWRHDLWGGVRMGMIFVPCRSLMHTCMWLGGGIF